MRTHHLLLIGATALAMFADPSVVMARPVDGGSVVTAMSAPPGATFGVGGTGFRRVADVVRQVGLARGSVARALDPDLVALADDPTAFLDANDRLLYIDRFEAPPVAGSADIAPDMVPAPGPQIAQGVYLPPANTFALNSRPGSTKTIFLDFDGYTVTGTAWNNHYDRPAPPYPYPPSPNSAGVAPYDYDGIPGRSATDELYIRAIWQAVADDYAAFDVNVTTQQPTDDALFRSSAADTTYGSIAVITPDKWLAPSNICGSGCGGVAYVGVFGQINDEYYAPAWVFASSSSSWTSVADTISHEVGHNLGLDHDGLSGVSSCPSASYFGGNGSGTGSWGPIMGSPFGRQYSQWSKGEYTCANNFQDDVAIIGAKTGIVPDESSSFGNAVAIPTTELPTADQVVGSAGDLDYFSITATGGYLKVTLTRTVNGTSLYPRFSILNSVGTELAVGFLTSTTSGSLELTGLSPGTYYVSVTGSGSGTPQTGFSNYGSLGYFNVAAQTFATPSTPGSPSLVATGSQALTASWTASTTLSPLAPITYAVSLCDAVSAVCSTPVDTTATSLILTSPTPTGSYVARVNARHIAGRVSANATTAAATVLTVPIAPTPFSLSFNELNNTVTIAWAGEQQFAPVVVTGRTLTVVNRSTGLTELNQSIPATGSLNFTTLLADVWLDASIVSTTGSPSPWSSSAPSPVGSVFLGRLPAPQAAGPAGGPRSSAPQSAGATAPGRPAAPQA